ncbi:hypothetical protein D3C87_1128460 [compost metagenome]
MQRTIGVLKHHLHLPEEFRRALQRRILAGKGDAAFPAFIKAGHGAQDGGLARAAFANDAEAAALFDRKGHALHHFTVAELDTEIFDVDHRLDHAASRLRTGRRSRGCVSEGMQFKRPCV